MPRNPEDIVREKHAMFVCTLLGSQFLPSSMRQYVPADCKVSSTLDPVTRAYTLGRLGLPETVDETLFVRRQESARVSVLRKRLASTLCGLADKAANKVANAHLSLVGRPNYEKVFAEIVSQVCAESTKDFTRLLYTELFNCVCEGQIDYMLDVYGPACLVYKLPKSDACAYCKYLYTLNGIPRVFRLESLLSNGTNEYRKPNDSILQGVTKDDDWQAVACSAHSWCRCGLYHLPDGHTFNKDGNIVAGIPQIENYNAEKAMHMCGAC